MSDENKKKKALEELEVHLNRARKEISKAESIADEHGLSFNWDLAYGMGGTYTGKGVTTEEQKEEWGNEDGWRSSSSGC